jgi:hypothetical protein
VDGWPQLEGSAAANVPHAPSVHDVIQKTSEFHGVECNDKQIDQLALRVSLVETLFQQFSDTERKVLGCWAAENIIP